ncbi:MAG TPA: 30S ribosomal protein S6 [Candidatus Limnocylindria bacterium]|jgi:small subunit ribosomal protein S6
MRRYELMLLLRPDLEDDKLQAAVEKVTRAIVNAGGSLSKVSPWGKRRLAYDIGAHREASYFLIHFDIEPSQVREIERGMLISEEILRHLVTVLEDRGPVDGELAPAATPRDAADGEDDDADSERDDLADADAAAEAAEPVAATVAVTAGAADDVPVSDVPADVAPDDEERAAS